MNEEFVDIKWPVDHGKPKSFDEAWNEQCSGKHSGPVVNMHSVLSKLYPNHSIVLTQDRSLNILGFPGASFKPIDSSPFITNIAFIPLPARFGVPGMLVDFVETGVFEIKYNDYKFILFTIKYPSGFSDTTQHFLLNEGPEEPVRLFLLNVGTWGNRLQDEIWVFNQGWWQKNHGLWVEIQKASWKDVILKDEFKNKLKSDIYGFFESEAIYKELAIPWKRGIIMYGPPGNGKTISIKTIMKTCSDKGFIPLYVKSFQSYAGEEASMAAVFDKAREVSPCVVVIEDLDSLINDQNRSFFLNQLDGLEGNDGLLVIGTTNHFERLDPGLSTRPSRFDRKYLFDDPDREERGLYAKYWQTKLATNKEIEFPDSLIGEIVALTDLFSFAYLKEAFVSSLVTLAGKKGEENPPNFASVIKAQIKVLREQLDKAPKMSLDNLDGYTSNSTTAAPPSWLEIARSRTNRAWNIQRSIGDTQSSRIYASDTENVSRRATYSSDIRPFNDMAHDGRLTTATASHRFSQSPDPTVRLPQTNYFTATRGGFLF